MLPNGRAYIPHIVRTDYFETTTAKKSNAYWQHVSFQCFFSQTYTSFKAFCQFCLNHLSATTNWKSSKFHRKLHNQEELCLLETCSVLYLLTNLCPFQSYSTVSFDRTICKLQLNKIHQNVVESFTT